MSQYRILAVCLSVFFTVVACSVCAQTSPTGLADSAIDEAAAAKLELGITSDPLPVGFRAKAGRKAFGDVEWVLVKVWNPVQTNLSGEVFVEERAMPTHAERLAASKTYIGGLFSLMKGKGFVPVDAQVPDLARMDFRERTLLQFKFENEQKNAVLCGAQIWFDDATGYCGAVISKAGTSRQGLLKWLGSLKSNPKEKPVRTWTSLAGQKTEGTLESATIRNASLRLNNGKSVTVPISQLSKADQDYVKNSPLRPTVYSDPRHPAQTLLPFGFNKSLPLQKGTLSYRHLDGSGIHFQVIALPDGSKSDLPTLLKNVAKVPGEQISTLTGAKVSVVTASTPKPVNGIVAQYYLMEIGQKTLLVVAESHEQKMPQHRPEFEKMVQMMQMRP